MSHGSLHVTKAGVIPDKVNIEIMVHINGDPCHTPVDNNHQFLLSFGTY
jgi:hypothetical protein